MLRVIFHLMFHDSEDQRQVTVVSSHELGPNDDVGPLLSCTHHDYGHVHPCTNSHPHFSMTQGGDRVATNSFKLGCLIHFEA